MVFRSKKKGLSPIIATVLLIAIALVLAVIIFLWARGFVSEQIQKGGEPIERACDDIVFEAEATETTIYVSNQGNVPLYGLEIGVKSRGGVSSGTQEYDQSGRSILSGAGGNAEIEFEGTVGDELLLVPIILGEGGDSKVMHVCDSSYGVPVTVS